MKIVFVSNYLNHHQLPLCKAFLRMPDVEFTFVATEAVSEERKKFGYVDMDHKYDFVIVAYQDQEQAERAQQEIDSADVVLMGVDPKKYIRNKKQLVFLYSERFLRQKKHSLAYYINVLRSIKNHTIHQKKNHYVLCAGAYVAEDFKAVGAFRKRMYKWGYFPEVYELDLDKQIDSKEYRSLRFLWVGRYLDWKQPKDAVEAIRALCDEGYDVTLDMIGSGEQECEVEELIKRYALSEVITMHGPMGTEQVREHMVRSDVFLFTSNMEEGWGAVLNEAMNSRCAVVANKWIGAVPYLLDHSENGLIYDGTVEDLVCKARQLAENRNIIDKLGINAYRTMVSLWNANVAAEHFVELVERLQAGETCCRDMEGPCGFAG